ncbi:MAG: hypothetical protein HYV26_10535, partial [Candidatus Hydrogenedentes bacterium]|nr:hypothetical protein [Candidatus Hydrogenedentota bacterium]
DEAAFFMLTPLPGSRDHFNMVQQGTPLDADLNNYDSFHETFRHAKIPAGQWHGLYREAWATFYSKDNIVNMMLRVPPALYWRTLWLCIWNRYATLFGTHPMVTGFLRLKDRKGRRPTFAAEGRFTYARRRTRDLLHLACILVQLFFEFQEIWLLTRPKRDVRWTVLADIRRRWAEAQQRIADSTLAGHCDVAAEELRALLGAASARLHELSSRGSALSGRARRRVRRLAGELDAYIASYELQMPSWRTVLKGEEYIREHLVTGYEELAIRSVATRRQINAYYRDCLQRLKTGRILTANVSMLPRALAFEFVFALRFAWAFFHHV